LQSPQGYLTKTIRMLKIACFITGDNYTMVANDTPASKKKIIAMAIAIALPVTIWLANGFILSRQVLKAGITSVIITSLICGTVIFVIEKLIIMAKGNGWLTLVRISIGLIVAILGSIALDEVIFKSEIDTGMPFLKQEYTTRIEDQTTTQFNKQHNYEGLENDIQQAQAKYDTALESAIKEADGTAGTKAKGVGRIATFKNKKADERKTELENLLKQKQALDGMRDSVLNIAQSNANASFDEHGLLVRVKALFNLVFSDNYMLIIYLLLTALMFFFEFIVVILKLTWKKTNYERKVELIEEIGQRRLEYLKQRNAQFADPGFSFEPSSSKKLLTRRNKLFT
jgi:hypothetical protein